MKYLVLVAEDDKDIGRAIVLRLKREAWDVIWETDGDSALKAILENMPDLVILDIMMPGMNGFQVLEAIKGNDVTRHIPVVFLTARGDPSDVRLGIELHVADYIVKPFKLNDMAARVKRLLENVVPRRRETSGPGSDHWPPDGSAV